MQVKMTDGRRDLTESNESMTVAGNILIRLKSLNRSLTMNAVWHPSLMTAVTIPDIRFNLLSVHSRAHPIDTIWLTLQQSICLMAGLKMVIVRLVPYSNRAILTP